MNLPKKGPDLKMPDLKAPAVLSDLYYDLRDRRLLPLIALVVAAIVAVPFLLSDPVETPPPPSADAGAAIEARASKLTVVEATPGLRDYRKRLDERSPADPFEQKYTSANLKGADLPDEEGGGSGEGDGSKGSGKKGPEGEADGGESAPISSDGSRPGEFVLYSWAINVRITRSGGDEAEEGEGQSEPIVKKEVLPQTPLPGEKAPVVTYMGLSKKSKRLDRPRILLLVSPDVKSVFGDGHCVSGDEVCQMLEVEPGFPEVFVYGENEVHYTLNIVKASLVVVARRRH